MEMGQAYSKKGRQQIGQTLHRMITKEREEIKGTTKQKMAGRHSKEEGNHLKQDTIKQPAVEDIDGGLHLAVDRQSLNSFLTE